MWGAVAASAAATEVRAFLGQHCLGCHGVEKQKADRRFDALDIDLTRLHTARTWQEIVDVLNKGEMPPPEEVRPDAEAQRRVVAWMTEQLAAAYRHHTTGSGPFFRRMNRVEYRNTLRDLLGLNLDSFNPTAAFPPDERHHGFENLGDRLTLSSHLMEQYLSAAEAALDKVAQRPRETPPFSVTFKPDDFNVPPGQEGTSRNGHFLHRPFEHYMVNGRGAWIDLGHSSRRFQRLRVPAFAGVPADGFYVIRVRAAGLHRRNRYDPRVLNVNPEEPVKLELIANDPAVGDGGLGTNRSNRTLAVFALKDDEPDNYEVRVWLDRGYEVTVRYANGPPNLLRPGQILLERHHPEAIVSNYKDEFSQAAPPGEVPKAWFSDVYEGPRVRLFDLSLQADAPQPGDLSPVADWFAPLTPGERESLLPVFVESAFRRPVAPSEAARYGQFYRTLLAQGTPPEEAWRTTLKTVLCAPDFLYVEMPPPATSTDTANSSGAGADDFTVAARLAYFLWSSMPDRELLTLAREGKLRDPDEVLQQTQRMLRDAKARAFVENFTDGWLRLNQLGTMPPDATRFPIYEQKELEPQMREETRRFFAELLLRDGDIGDFLDSDYAFLTADLAALYGVAGVEGDEFRRVTLPSHSARGGLLGQASVLTATSNGVETSPVTRGVWVLENILGTPPAPPPPDVSALMPDIRGATTVREQLARHRTIQACAECHRKIDPLGFALEAFDPIGRYRTRYPAVGGGQALPIDTAGELHTGEVVADVKALRAALRARHRPQFAHMLAEKLLTYARGRGLALGHRPSLAQAVAEAERAGGGLRAYVEAVVRSDAFLGK